MSKSVHDDVLDAALNYIKTNCNWICVCEDEPLTYDEAHLDKGSGGKVLAHSTTPSFTGPQDGTTSGRKLIVDDASHIPISVTGIANHVALCDTVNLKLLYVTTCDTQTLTFGNTVTIPHWNIEIADPT